MEKDREKIRIPWSESVWFFDIDDTLSDTTDVSSTATIGIYRVCIQQYGETIAKKLQMGVNNYYSLMVAGYRVKSQEEWVRIKGGARAYRELIERVTRLQNDVVKKYGMAKKWSREIFLKLTADDLAIPITSDLISEAVDNYWIEISKQTSVFPDAKELLNAIRRHNRPVYLVTSSDARLQLQPDGQFLYDPRYSEALKRQRIELLRDKGINFNVLSIGDPEDKPNRDFFDKAVRKAEADWGSPINMGNAIMFGDSFAGDLQTPKELMGFGLVVCIDRSKSHFDIIDTHQVNTNDMSKVTQFLTASS